MLKIKRDFFHQDPVIDKLASMLKSAHLPANHTLKILRKNSHIKDFCEQARHYTSLRARNRTVYLHYDVSSWIESGEDEEILVRIDEIAIYDNFMEFEKMRLSGLHNSPDADIPNIN